MQAGSLVRKSQASIKNIVKLKKLAMASLIPQRLLCQLAHAARHAQLQQQAAFSSHAAFGALSSLQQSQQALPSPSALNSACQPSMVARSLASSTCAASSSGPHRGEYHATTILCIRKDGQVAMVGDGQVGVAPIVSRLSLYALEGTCVFDQHLCSCCTDGPTLHSPQQLFAVALNPDSVQGGALRFSSI